MTDVGEQRLREAIEDLLDTRPSRVIPAFAEALEVRGVRVLMAAVGIGDLPQVAATLGVDDVTEEVTKQVVVKVLERVGLGRDAAVLMASTAATVVSRWIARQRLQRAQEREAGGGAARRTRR